MMKFYFHILMTEKLHSENDSLQVSTCVYLLLFKHVDVFDEAKLAEQLGQVIRHLGGGAPLTAG